MPAELFEKNEKGYLKWINHNPKGYVLNTNSNKSFNYIMIHKATCRDIIILRKEYSESPFTGDKWIKTCSTKLAELENWIHSNNTSATITIMYCQHCKPNIISQQNRTTDLDHETTLEDLNKIFIDQVNESLNDPDSRRKRLKLADKIPQKTTSSITRYKRNPDVVAERLHLANGKCDICKQKAPFVRRSDNSPYLEVHHKIPLGKKGKDAVENTLALCPNCHMKSHYGK